MYKYKLYIYKTVNGKQHSKSTKQRNIIKHK